MTPLLALAASIGLGCIGVSQKRSAGGGIVGGNVADLSVCRTGVRVADDGAVDDFEDGNNEISPEGGRDGFWWTTKDDKGSTIGPAPFSPSEGGGSGSELAMHATGATVGGDGAWGAMFGADLQGGKQLYDASKYVGITFRARVAEGASRRMRIKLADVNTHPVGQICKTCWNHFGKDLTLTTEWKEYRVLFTDVRQADGWGDPRPPALNPSKLVAINFSIDTGQQYDVWVDDLAFLSCK